jgi:hypothetical protein
MSEYKMSNVDKTNLRQAAINADILRLIKFWFNRDSNYQLYQDSINCFQSFFNNAFKANLELSNDIGKGSRLLNALYNFHIVKYFISDYDIMKQWLDEYKKHSIF